MRQSLAEPVRDPKTLRELVPLIKHVFALHESGVNYQGELHAVSKLVGRAITPFEVDAAFGSGNAEGFAQSLLIDWEHLPTGLSESELLELMEAVCTAKGDQVSNIYWLKCLEANTKDDQIASLIFWPDEYFGERYDGRELTPAEMLAVALQRGAARGNA